jgi:hypothetical protein
LATFGLAAILGALLAVTYAYFDSLPAAIAYLRGDRISLSPRLLDVGTGVAGDHKTVDVEVTNWTDKPIRLFGGTSDCSCTVLDDLPVTVPAKGHRVVSVHVLLKGRPGTFTRKGAFLVDDEGFQVVGFVISGRIAAETSVARTGAAATSLYFR